MFSDIRKGKITSKFQSLERVLVEDTKGFMSPEKFRDLRETGPWTHTSCCVVFTFANCDWLLLLPLGFGYLAFLFSLL